MAVSIFWETRRTDGREMLKSLPLEGAARRDSSGATIASVPPGKLDRRATGVSPADDVRLARRPENLATDRIAQRNRFREIPFLCLSPRGRNTTRGHQAQSRGSREHQLTSEADVRGCTDPRLTQPQALACTRQAKACPALGNQPRGGDRRSCMSPSRADAAATGAGWFTPSFDPIFKNGTRVGDAETGAGEIQPLANPFDKKWVSARSGNRSKP